jgi:biotin carboxyl carrier protein
VTFEVEVGGRRRRVEMTNESGRWRVTVDGHVLETSVAAAGDRWSLLVSSADAVDASHDVAIQDRGRGEMVVHVDGTAVPVTVLGRRGSWSRRGHDHGGAADGPQAIVAPMPGRVVKVLVQPGDAVAARQGLVVVEAMKMENELRAPREGRVIEVRAREGASVEANAVLIVME